MGRRGLSKGESKDLPAALRFDDSSQWRMGQPDLIVTLPKDRIVPAKGADQ